MQAQQAASSAAEWVPTIVTAVLAVLALVVVVKVLQAIGAVLSAVGRAAKALILLGKGVAWLVKTAVLLLALAGRFWRTTACLAALGAWLLAWGLVPGVIVLALTVAVLGSAAVAWLITDPESFDDYLGRHLRSWGLRWGYYGLRWSTWVRNLGLTVREADSVNVAREGSASSGAAMVTLDTPKIERVISGPTWDEVRVKLAVGQTVEDFDEKTLALASARRSARCVVRELEPGFVAVDFERRDSLAEPLPAPDLVDTSVDLRKVAIGSTEYGRPWLFPLFGFHTLCAGVTGSGKNSVMFAVLRAVAPAIRDGLVRVRGVDPKVLEMEFVQDMLYRYATTPKDAADLIAEYLADMDARKESVRGSTRKVQPTVEAPLDLLVIDELGALTKYLADRHTRERITQMLGLGLTQTRALAGSILAFVQDPTKETVPMRDLFPHRVCLRTQTESQTEMVLGDGAVARGALSHRIPEEGAEGVGYVLGEKHRRPVRARAGWTDDDGVTELAEFCTPNGPLTGPVVPPVAELDTRRSSRRAQTAS